MDIKNYQKTPEVALTFEQWKADLAPSFDEEMIKSMNRLHGVDYRKEFDETLKREYQEYLDNLNGNWLLK